MDDTDRALLIEVQKNSDLSADKLSQALVQYGLELQGPGVGARLKKLKKDGFIKQSVTLLNASQCGFNVYILLIRLKDGSTNAEDSVRDTILSIGEVVEFHTFLGNEVHNLVKVLANDVSRVNMISRMLRNMPEVENVTSLSVAETHRYTTAVPIPAPTNGAMPHE